MQAEIAEAWKKVDPLIDREALIELALTLGKIDSPAGNEAPAGNYLFDWLQERNMAPRRVGFAPNRFCVAASVPGKGGGPSLVFNAHMDTSMPDDATLKIRPTEMKQDLAWIDGEYIVGKGVINDKGPMAAFLIATDAIRRAGIALKGDIVLTMVPGEIDQEPVDEFTGTQYLSKEVGSRYIIARGAIGDYALIAEGTDFDIAWAVAGKACFKISVYGKSVYVPFMPPRTEPSQSPNAIIKMAPVLLAIEEWAARYERDYTIDTPGGRVIPKLNVGAIRAGEPFHISSSAKVCSIYIDVRLVPGADVMAIRESLRELLKKCGVDGSVELYTFRKGQVAEGVEPLVEAVSYAHSTLDAPEPKMAAPAFSSMWRDHLVFIEAGVPALTYGPSGSTGGRVPYSMKIDDLVRAARSYALIALNMCSRTKEART